MSKQSILISLSNFKSFDVELFKCDGFHKILHDESFWR